MRTSATAWTSWVFVSIFTSLLVPAMTYGQQFDAELSLNDQSIDELKFKREEMLRAYGPRHPKVVAIDKMIENQSKIPQPKGALKPAEKKPSSDRLRPSDAGSPKMPSAPSLKVPVNRLSDDELRLTVQRLLERIEALEREVRQLKNPPAKAQLLGR